MQYSPITTTWRPWPLSRPFLLVFTSLCLLIVFYLEVLLRNPRLLTSKVIPYAPTTISVLLGVIWATAAHDYKRLEPYFQLSNPMGAPAKSTLLLDYSYKSPLLVPFSAAKNRHIPVLLSSISLLFISLALTPSLSSIFDDTTTTLTRSDNTGIAGIAQDQHLSSRFAYLAYSRSWLSGRRLEFTTDEFALSPFSVGEVNETWRGATKLYEGELRCRLAVPTPLFIQGVGEVGMTLTAGKTAVQYMMRDMYYGYSMEEQDIVDEALGKYSDRPESNPVTFMVGGWTSLGVQVEERLVYIWGPRSNDSWMGIDMGFQGKEGSSWTAVMCDPEYWEQGVVATVDIASGEVLEVQREGSRVPFDTLGTREFMQTVHTGQVGTVLASNANLTDMAKMNITFGNIPTQLPSVDSQMKRRFGETFETPTDMKSALLYYHANPRGLAAFAMYSRVNGSLADLLNPEELGRTYERAFKLMFANAVAAEMVDREISTPVTVERMFRATGWTVNAWWARLAQVGFGLLAFITTWLVIITWGRRSNLQGDPNSLEASITLLSASRDVRQRLEDAEYYDPQLVSEMLSKGKERYHLSLVPGKGPQIDIINSDWGSGLLPPLESKKAFYSKPSWILAPLAGLGLFVFFFILLCLLIFVFSYDRSHNGLPTLFSPASFGYKALFSYLPTVLGTTIEPLIVTIGAYYCMMGPYKLLRQQFPGPLPLLIDYDKSPPLFQFFRALRARDIQLVMLTVGILLANVLAVSLGALFSLEEQSRIVSVEVNAQALPKLISNFTEPITEVYYDLAANFSGEVPLANWATPEYYVQPFNTTTPHLTLSATTVALGAEISCSLVPDHQIITMCKYWGVEYPGCIDIAPLLPGQPDGRSMVSRIGVNHTCWPIGSVGRPSQYYFQWEGPTVDFFKLGCVDSFFVGWAELPADPHPKKSFFPFSHISRIDTVVLYCTAGVRGAAVTARVGNTTSVSKLSPLDITAIGNTSALVASFLANVKSADSTTDPAHEIPWLSSLMTTLNPSLPTTNRTNSTSLPHTDQVVETFENVYRRVFASSIRAYADTLFASGEKVDVVGEAMQLTQRVRVNGAMWGLSTGIMGYFLVLVVAVYWRTEMGGVTAPTTLARGWALLYASGGLERGAKGYGLGEFVGEDGRRHWGVHPRRDDEEQTELLERITTTDIRFSIDHQKL